MFHFYTRSILGGTNLSATTYRKETMLFLFLIFIYFYVYGQFACVYVGTPHMSSAGQDQRKSLDLLKTDITDNYELVCM